MEKNIDIFIKDVVREMFRGTNANILNEKIKGDTSPTKAAKRELGNVFQKYHDSLTNNEKDIFSASAKNIGINLDKGKQRNAEADAILNRPDINGSYEKAVGTMSGELKQALMDYNEWANSSTPPERKKEILRHYGGYGGLRRYLDMADKFSLTPAYDKERAKESGINFAPFGSNYKASKVLTNDDGSPKIDDNGDYVYDSQEYLSKVKPMPTPEKKNKKGEIVRHALPADKVTGYDIENLDLTNVTDDEICRYFKTGTRQDHHFGENENNPTYGEMAEMAKNGDKNALADLKNLFFKAMFN